VPADEQLARVLGPDWQALRFTQLYDRAYRLEAVARLDRALAAYMVETSLETAGAAIDQLKGNGDAPLARSPLEA
jgi:hypothetical protein